MIPPHTKAIPLTPLRGPQARRGIFLPTRPVACTDPFILSHPIFLSKDRSRPFGGLARTFVSISQFFRARRSSARAASRPVGSFFCIEFCFCGFVPGRLNESAADFLLFRPAGQERAAVFCLTGCKRGFFIAFPARRPPSGTAHPRFCGTGWNRRPSRWSASGASG